MGYAEPRRFLQAVRCDTMHYNLDLNITMGLICSTGFEGIQRRTSGNANPLCKSFCGFRLHRRI